MNRELTGRHVLIIVVSAFSMIIAANMTMLFAATGSFPGLVVANSYVASQGWNARADAQRDLGWKAQVSYQPGALRIALIDANGGPAGAAAPMIKIGRPTNSLDDRQVQAVRDATSFRAPVDLPPGRWRLQVIVSDPVRFTAATEILVPGAD